MSTEPHDPTVEPPGYDAIRALLGDVDVPADQRDRAIATALAEFDRLHASQAPAAPSGTPLAPADTTEPPSNVVPLRRPTRWLYGLAGAAAAAVAAVVVIGLGNRSTTTSDVAIQRPTATNLTAATSVADAAVQQADSLTPDSRDGELSRSAAPPAPAAAVPANEAAPGTDTHTDTGVLAADTGTAGIPEYRTPGDAPSDAAAGGAAKTSAAPQTPITTVQQLREFVIARRIEIASTVAGGTTPPWATCLDPRWTVVGEIVYVQRPAVVVTSPTGDIAALDASTCATLVSVAG